MIDEIIKENAGDFSEKGLNYEKFKNYLEEEDSSELGAKVGLVCRGEIKLKNDTLSHFRVAAKPINDADVMYSLVLNKLGIKAPSYMPLDLQGTTIMLRDDFSDVNDSKEDIDLKDCLGHNIPAKIYNNIINEHCVIPDLRHKLSNQTNPIKRYFTKKEILNSQKGQEGKRSIDAVFSGEAGMIKQHFDPKALNLLAKIGIVKLSMLTTRNSLTSNVYELGNAGRVKDVFPVKTGGEVVHSQDLADKVVAKDKLHYQTQFATDSLSHKQVINQIKNNEIVSEVLADSDRRAFVEKLGNLNVCELAQEYKDATNYKVDTLYLLLLKIQKDRVCEELVK